MDANWDNIISLFDFETDKDKNLKFLLKLANMRMISIFKNLPHDRLIQICRIVMYYLLFDIEIKLKKIDKNRLFFDIVYRIFID